MPQAGRLLATGASAEIFLQEDGLVLKLLHAGFPEMVARTEGDLANKARSLGLPVPLVHAQVEREGRFGLVMDSCRGPTWLQLLEQGHPDPAGLGLAFFELQRRIHLCDTEGLLPLHPGLARQIGRVPGIPEELRARLIGMTLEAPVRIAACHADFHPMNVIQTAAGPQVVDWGGLGWGDPALDINRTFFHLRFAEVAGVDPAVRAAFVGAYQAACEEAWQGRLHELWRWQAPVAVARLSRAGLDPQGWQDVWRVAIGEDNLWACGPS